MSNVKVIVKGKARSRIALGVVAAYLRLHPNTTFLALKEVFPDSICPKAPVQFRSLVPLGVFQPLDLVKALPEKGLAIAHYVANNEILNTADGVTIAVTKSWTQEAFEALNIAAATHGIAIMTVDEGAKWASGTYELDFIDTHQPPKADMPTAPPPSEEPQPEAFDEYIHQAVKKHKALNGKRWLASLSVATLLLLMGVTALVHRSSCSGIFGSKVVDTIVIEADENFQPVREVKKDKVEKLQAVVKDSTAAPQPKAVTPAATPRKKRVRDTTASHNAQKVVTKKAMLNKNKKEEQPKKVDKGEKKKVEKGERGEKVEKADKVDKVEKKVEKAEKADEVEKVEKTEKVEKVEKTEKPKQAEEQQNAQPSKPKEKKPYSQEPLF